jgi:probable rRNA maturation factor
MPPGESSIVYRERFAALKRQPLQAFVAELARRIGGGRELSVLVARDAEIRNLNRRFRAQDAATDVLSFPSTAPGSFGEIAVSYDRALAQAREYGHGVEAEVRLLLLHGALHLAGLDHETDNGEMAQAEKRWRARFGLPDGLIQRAAS